MLQKKIFLYLILIFSSFVFGCVDKEQEMAGDNTIYSAQESTLTISSLPTESQFTDLIPTEDEINLHAQTLPDEKMVDKQTFLDMLSDNDGCILPCVLGINPGTANAAGSDSNWIPTTQFIGDSEVSFKKQVFDDFVVFTTRVFRSESVIVIALTYEFDERWDDTHIDDIRLSMFQHDTTEENFGQAIYGSNEYRFLVSRYSSNTLLKEYGQPTQVVLRIETDDGFLEEDQSGFGIVTLGYYYAQHQFYVEYEFIVDDISNGFDICPSNGRISLRSWSALEEGSDSFFTNSSIDISLDLDSYKEIDSYEGVTTDLFYEVMSGDDDSACFLFPGLN